MFKVMLRSMAAAIVRTVQGLPSPEFAAANVLSELDRLAQQDPGSALARYLAANSESRINWMAHVADIVGGSLSLGLKSECRLALREGICFQIEWLSMAKAFLARTPEEQSLLVGSLFGSETVADKQAEFTRDQVLTSATLPLLRKFAKDTLQDARDGDYSAVYQHLCDSWYLQCYEVTIAHARSEPCYVIPFAEATRQLKEDTLKRIKAGQNFALSPEELKELTAPPAN